MRAVLAGLLSAAAVAAAPGVHAETPAGAPASPAGLAQRTPPVGLAQQRPATGPGLPGRERAPHRPGELDCRNCHLGTHRGIVEMYLGMGGRGTPMIPSHMVQVRVECVACHIVPKEGEQATAGLAGQTFRPSEQACLGCHGDRYRGMLDRWTATLTRMTALVGPKLAAARAALAAAGGRARPRAERLLDDAEANIRFVTVAKGVHNVFYAADLLKLADGWLDEALALLGAPPVKTEDQLLRGGYCAVLCHEAAGVRQPATVTFGRLTVPHVRHVSEFGATCTSCHSPEVHKAVTATAATCASCHHSPRNDRCESCHRAQSAFYRGRVQSPLATIAPNLMAEAVGCTGCHDWSQKPSREALARACLACHEAPYTALLTEWTRTFRADLQQAGDAVRSAGAALARARRGGRRAPEAEALLKDAQEALELVRKGGVAHNPLAADALLTAARQKAAQARARLR